MNTLQMQYFDAVAELMSFTRAAERLYVSQPAVSKQISMLENELGVKLFERSRVSGLSLTQDGERYLALFRDFLAGLEKTAADIEQARSARACIRVGIPEGWELPHEVRQLFEGHGFEILWQAHSFRELGEKLIGGELDMVASLSMEQYEGNAWLRTMPFMKLRGILLFSAQHDRAGDSFTVSDFKGERMYLLENPEGPRVDNTRLIGPLGFDPPVSFMPNRDSILLALEKGDGFAYFDEWVRYTAYPNFAYIYTGTFSTTHIYWRRDAGTAVERMAEEISASSQLLQN